MEAIKLCRLDTPIIFIEARINLSRFVVTGCAAKTSATVTFPSLNLISPFSVLFHYLVKRRGVLTHLGTLDKAFRGQFCFCENFHPEVAHHLDSEQLIG